MSITLQPRGVYWASTLDPDGYPTLVAVDSRGRRVARRTILPGMDWRAEAAALTAALEATDRIVTRGMALLK